MAFEQLADDHIDELESQFVELLAKIDRESSENRDCLLKMMAGLERLKTLFTNYDPEDATVDLELATASRSI